MSIIILISTNCSAIVCSNYYIVCKDMKGMYDNLKGDTNVMNYETDNNDTCGDKDNNNTNPLSLFL